MRPPFIEDKGNFVVAMLTKMVACRAWGSIILEVEATIKGFHKYSIITDYSIITKKNPWWKLHIIEYLANYAPEDGDNAQPANLAFQQSRELFFWELLFFTCVFIS